jgi:hypothetical protein
LQRRAGGVRRTDDVDDVDDVDALRPSWLTCVASNRGSTFHGGKQRPMRAPLVLAAAVAGISVVGLLCLGFFLFMVGGGPCVETELSTQPSADGAYTMRHTQRGCGATTVDTEGIALNGEEIFVVETHYEPYVATWTGPRELTIRFSVPTKEAVACTVVERLEDVTIVYDEAVKAALALGDRAGCPG